MAKQQAWMTIRRDGKAVDFGVPSSNDPTGAGEMVFRLTTQQCRDHNGLVPHKVCRGCRQSDPAIGSIKTQTFRADGSSLISDSPFCYRCDPPPNFLFTYEDVYVRGVLKSKLKIDLTLHDENGEPIRSFDEKTRRWHALKSVGLRRMTDSNEIRMQPYVERGKDKDGHRYPRKKRGHLLDGLL